DGRLPRPDGCSGQAERAARNRVHGRDPAVPAPDRVPASDARDRAGMAGARRPREVTERTPGDPTATREELRGGPPTGPEQARGPRAAGRLPPRSPAV